MLGRRKCRQRIIFRRKDYVAAVFLRISRSVVGFGRRHAHRADKFVEIDVVYAVHGVRSDAFQRGDDVALRGKVVKSAPDAELDLQCERTVAEEQVDAAGVRSARHSEGGQEFEVFLGEFGHKRLDKTRKQVFGDADAYHIAREQHLSDEQIEHAPDVFGDKPRRCVADVDDERAVSRSHRLACAAAARNAGKQLAEIEHSFEFQFAEEVGHTVADGADNFAKTCRIEIDVRAEILVHEQPYLDGLRVLYPFAEEVGVNCDFEIDICPAEDCAEKRRGVDFAAAEQVGQHSNEPVESDLQRELDVKTYCGHEFRTVHRKGRQQHLEISVCAAVRLHKPGHLTRPVDCVAESEVERQRAAYFHRFKARILQAAHQHIENCTRGVRAFVRAAYAGNEVFEVERKQRLVIGEDGRLLVRAL